MELISGVHFKIMIPVVFCIPCNTKWLHIFDYFFSEWNILNYNEDLLKKAKMYKENTNVVLSEY